MHADRPGDRPRLLYWYRTAPDIGFGRSPLDEDAIRTIEEQHPDIDFDWPAILALSEVMTPEDEAPPKRQPREQRQGRRSVVARDKSGELRREGLAEQGPGAVTPDEVQPDIAAEPPTDREFPHSSGLVDQLAGREIASRLRGRYAEITLRLQGADDSIRESLMKLAGALDPDRWDTPDAVLHGVRSADALFEQLRTALSAPKP